MSRPTRLLMICSGNICRSPMAEVLAIAYAKKIGRDLEVRSAGTLLLDGEPAHWHSIEAVAELGLDLEPHISQGVTAEIAGWADYLLVKENHHAQWLRENLRGAGAKTLLLGTYGSRLQIPDPIGGNLQAFRGSRDEIRAAVEQFIDRLPEHRD